MDRTTATVLFVFWQTEHLIARRILKQLSKCDVRRTGHMSNREKDKYH